VSTQLPAQASDRGGALLAGRVALVTGTGPNIGAGIALSLAEAGAAVACLDRVSRHAEACAEDIAAGGGTGIGYEADVTDEASVRAVVDAVSDALGGVDVLVNAAAFYNEKGLLEMPLDEWRAQVDVILTGAFVCTQAVAQHLIQRGAEGAIVNLASTAAHQGQPGNIAYSTAKAGILNFTRAAAVDLAPYGIRVNSMTPTSTDLVEAQQRAARYGAGPADRRRLERLEQRRALLPLERLPSPSDYGRAVVFLASDHARTVTGTDLRVDSGALASYWGHLRDEEGGVVPPQP
jgi:NAD(P)-dependent dehydrogenase (short-subunit alcohol dehydrogenase family)